MNGILLLKMIKTYLLIYMYLCYVLNDLKGSVKSILLLIDVIITLLTLHLNLSIFPILLCMFIIFSSCFPFFQIIHFLNILKFCGVISSYLPPDSITPVKISIFWLPFIGNHLPSHLIHLQIKLFKFYSNISIRTSTYLRLDFG